MEGADYPELVVSPHPTRDTRVDSVTISPTSPAVAQGFPDRRPVTWRRVGSQDEIQQEERGSRLLSITSTAPSPPASRNASVVPSLTSTSLSNLSDWKEEVFPRFRVNGHPEVYQILLPWDAASVGLSNDCTSAFFFRERSLAVVSLASVQNRGSQQRVEHTFIDTGRLREVSASEHYIAALADEYLMLLKYHFSAPTSESSLEVLSWVPIGWDPKGLAIHENRDEVLLLAGERRQGLEGRIKLYKYTLQNNRGKRIHELQTFRVTTGTPTGVNDLPVSLAFGPSGRNFVCTTKGVPYNNGIDRRKCSVLVWSLDGDSGTASRPYAITYRYTAETDAGGITSALLFNSPSNKSYVLATTSPSSERARNGGEWSFISPYSSHQQADFSPLIHRFENLAKYPSLLVGAVPQYGNLVAVLEKTGNISTFPLIPDDHAGLSTSVVAGQQPVRLAVPLCPQRRMSMGHLRFDPSGTLLYAIDSKGKLLRTSFAQEFPADLGTIRGDLISPDLQELPSRDVFEIGQSVNPEESLKPDLDYTTSSEGNEPAHGSIARPSILDKLKLRKVLRRW